MHHQVHPLCVLSLDLHMLLAGVSLTIVVLVFALMFYATVRHRQSTDHGGGQFQSNALMEIVWTLIPCLIVAGMAYPAMRTVFAVKGTSHSDLVQITFLVDLRNTWRMAQGLSGWRSPGRGRYGGPLRGL